MKKTYVGAAIGAAQGVFWAIYGGYTNAAQTTAGLIASYAWHVIPWALGGAVFAHLLLRSGIL